MQGRRTRQIARISREGDGDGDTNTVAHVTTPHPPCINSHVNIDFSMEVVHLYVFEPLVRALLKAFIPKLRSEDAVQNEMEYATAQPLRKNQPTVCAIRFLSRFASLLALFTGIFRRNTLRINRRTPPTTIRPSSSLSRSSVSLSSVLLCAPQRRRRSNSAEKYHHAIVVEEKQEQARLGTTMMMMMVVLEQT